MDLEALVVVARDLLFHRYKLHGSSSSAPEGEQLWWQHVFQRLSGCQEKQHSEQ